MMMMMMMIIMMMMMMMMIIIVIKNSTPTEKILFTEKIACFRSYNFRSYHDSKMQIIAKVGIKFLHHNSTNVIFICDQRL